MNGTATKPQIIGNGAATLYEVGQGEILDAHGARTPRKEKGWMVKVDQKVSEKIELSKGTVWLIGTACVIGALLFSYGGSILGWTRQDQEIRTKVEVMSQQLKDLNTKIDKMVEQQQAQALKSAQIEGVKLGMASNDEQPKGSKK